MKERKVVPYYNEDHTKFAVLVTHARGVGWSSWYHDKRIAWDSEIIKYFLNPGYQSWADKLNELGYVGAYSDLVVNLHLVWVDCCKCWRVVSSDGAERIEYRDEIDWQWVPNY